MPPVNPPPPPSSSTSTKKRKHPPSNPNESHGTGPPFPAKRAKPSPLSSSSLTSSARSILAQSSDKALNKNGELDVAAFVKAREFEIKALQTSMKASKRALTSRAFQQVPRSLRRRTASHNVKRVPKRLRARAGREVS